MLNRAATQSLSLKSPSRRAALDGDVYRVSVEGSWTLAFLDAVYRIAEDASAAPRGARSIEIDCEQLEMLDTAGALALTGLQRRLAGAAPAAFVNASAEHRILLQEVARAASAIEAPPRPRSPLLLFLERLATVTTAILRDAYRLTMFLGEVSAALGRVIVHPRRFRGTAFIHQIQQTGLSAVPIIALVCVLLGGVIMQQAAKQLRNFGAEAMSVDMLGILTLREIGVVLAAVMVAGRSASAFTAQIGAMKTREEIDAMRTLGIDPIETLILPRILALIVALPLLVFVADMAALAGGAIMSKIYLDLDVPIYLQRLNSAVGAKHFYVGLIKAPFAALVIGLVGCLEGLSVEGSAESVGAQVTTAVVKAIFLVLVLDGVFAIFLSASGF